MSEGRRVRLTNSVVCTEKSCRKVSEGRRVRLLYLVSCIWEQLPQKYQKNSYSFDLYKAWVQRDVWPTRRKRSGSLKEFYQTVVLFGLDQSEDFETCFRSDQMRSFGFQGEYLCLTIFTSLTKKNLVTNETKYWGDWMVEVEKINRKCISHSVW